MKRHVFVLSCLLVLGLTESSFGSRADCIPLIERLTESGSRTGKDASRLEKLEVETGRGSLISFRERLTPGQIQEHNDKILEALKDQLDNSREDTSSTLTREQALVLLRVVSHHPTNGRQREREYDPKNRYGFCFGRAVMVHSEALRRGVDPASIKKIWAVGSLEKGKWHFHVATMIKSSRTGSWWVIDPVYGTVINAETWISRMQNSSDDKQMMVFVTDPRRFSVYSPQHYTEIDLLGDGISPDFYRGYFYDYLDFTARQPEPRPFR